MITHIVEKDNNLDIVNEYYECNECGKIYKEKINSCNHIKEEELDI